MSDLVDRLLKRAGIRRGIPRTEPDRISDILEEAAKRIAELEAELRVVARENLELKYENQDLSAASIMSSAQSDYSEYYK